MYHSQSGDVKSFNGSTKVNKINALFLFSVASVSLLVLSGCGAIEPRTCTEEARSSVNVILEEGGSASEEGVLLEYSVDGGEFKPCEDGPAQDEPFNPGESYVCGYEVAGDFVIRATRGAQVVTEEVTVTEDTCHVESKIVTLTFP